MERPPRLAVATQASPATIPPMMSQPSFKAGWLLVFSRLLVWFYAIARFFAGSLWDAVRGKNTIQSRAVRLRAAFERMGGTAIKIGQQLAMRIDLLPYEYGYELSKMLDRVRPFATRDAISVVERATGKPLGETFSAFDPEPIGSASVACVYQAVLRSGERVAVKVRRPGIGRLFVADCEALGWLFRGLELLTIIRPGLSHNFLYEFRTMLLEELDFVREARYTHLFRTRARRARLGHATSPKVHFALSSVEVLVTELVTGVWLSDVLLAMEQGDAAALQRLEAQRIDPKVVARRLLRVNQFGIFENLLFHADPHPANILVRADSEIVLIDFGSCGSYSKQERNIWRQIFFSHMNEDVAGMVQCALAILEPLPPIDVDEFSKKVEAVFWQVLCALQSKRAEWWERTSARIWISFLKLVREYSIPMNINTLRMIRATLLYETVAARLYRKADPFREYLRFSEAAGARARRRLRQGIEQVATKGLPKQTFLRIEQLLEAANRTLYLFQRLLDAPQMRFSMLIGKAAFTVSLAFRTVAILGGTALVATGVVLLVGSFTPSDGPSGPLAAALRVVTSKTFLAWVVVLGALQVRRLLFRVGDREVP